MTARIPGSNGVRHSADMVRATAPSGGRVPATGTMELAWALGDLAGRSPDPQVAAFVKAALRDLTRPAAPAALIIRHRAAGLIVSARLRAPDPRILRPRHGCRSRMVELGAQPARVTGVASVHSVPARIGPAVRRFGLSFLRLAAAVAVLGFLGRQVGAAPFRNGLGAVTWPAVVAAVTLTALATVCSAWRWRVVARALGVSIGLPGAVRAYYRSQFLNSVLPGGVAGDVHRAVAHGRRAGDVVRGLRAVAWERLCGQVVQAMVTAVVLLTLPSPVRPALPYVLAGLAGVAGCAALIVRGTARRGRSRLTRAARAVSADLRHGLLAPDVWPQLTLASVLVVAGHTTTFVIAARAAGSTAPLGELLALLMVVQTVMVIPLSVGGWGLREGAAAWAFGAAGLGAATGVAITTLYAVLMLAAVAPGAGLLLRDAVRRRRDRGHPAGPARPDRAPRALEVVRD